MARTAVAVTTINRAGVAPAVPSAADAVNKNVVGNDGRTWLEVSNTDTGPRTVTVALTVTVDGQTPAPKSYAIPAGATRRIGPFPVETYSAQLQVDADSALVTVAAYRIGS